MKISEVKIGDKVLIRDVTLDVIKDWTEATIVEETYDEVRVSFISKYNGLFYDDWILRSGEDEELKSDFQNGDYIKKQSSVDMILNLY